MLPQKANEVEYFANLKILLKEERYLLDKLINNENN